MRHSLFPLAVVLPLVLLGCGESSDDDDDDDSAYQETDGGPYCDEVEAVLDPADETGMGFTGADLLAALPSQGIAAIIWAGDSHEEGEQEDYDLAWGIAPTVGTLRYVTATEVYPETDGPTDSTGTLYCPDYVSVDGILTLVSDDSRLDETINFPFIITEEDAESMNIQFSDELDPYGLNGSFDITDFANPDDWDNLHFRVGGELQGGQLSGYLTVKGSNNDPGSGSDDWDWIARWGSYLNAER